jgi:hypothetical protein
MEVNVHANSVDTHRGTPSILLASTCGILQLRVNCRPIRRVHALPSLFCYTENISDYEGVENGCAGHIVFWPLRTGIHSRG